MSDNNPYCHEGMTCFSSCHCSGTDGICHCPMSDNTKCTCNSYCGSKVPTTI